MKTVDRNESGTVNEREQDRLNLRASLWFVGVLTLAMAVVLVPLAS